MIRKQIKNCPFCGSEGKVYGGKYKRVFCKNDKCILGVVALGDETAEKAIETWNRRYNPNEDDGK